jgi:DNA-binding GntR family transcriptional regulator
MLSPSDQDELDRVERLVEELKAIEKWDTAYWRDGRTEVHEKIAFLARRERRNEIIAQLFPHYSVMDN